ncbi:MAG: alpha/beta hydrolase family protein, partial [Nevskiales bacterium]
MQHHFQRGLYRAAITACAALLLAACGSSSAPGQSYIGTVVGAGETLAPDGQGKPCQAGLGRVYSVDIPSPLGNGETIGATVFEPAVMDCGKKYPLILWQNGFGTPRPQLLVPLNPETLVYQLLAPLAPLVAAGYGVISFDPSGIGTSGGKIRVQDPDYEGANVVRLVDWAEANLDWLAYGPSVDGSDPHNLMLGAIGPSYGGGYQNMLLAIDAKKRLDAIVPVVTWNDLRYSLAKNGVVKEEWLHSLYGNVKPEQFDPWLQQQIPLAFANDQPTPDLLDFLDYHSLSYFTGGQGVATDGGPGTAPRLAPVPPPMVNALYIQSPRDTLFNLNEATANYEALKDNGADVRLFTEQAGHNTLALLSDTGLLNAGPKDPYVLYQPDPTSLGTFCGGVQLTNAVLAFFNEHLKGMTGNVDQVLGTHPVCLSLTSLDSVAADAVRHGGTSFSIAADAKGNTVTIGQDDDQTTTVPLLTVSDASNVLAGIPVVDVTLTDTDNPSDNDTQNT